MTRRRSSYRSIASLQRDNRVCRACAEAGYPLESLPVFEGRPVHLNDLYWRSSNSTQQWWTLAYVPGSRYVNKEVYVLTSGRTFSAAEEFTNNLKTQKRATISQELWEKSLPDGKTAQPVAGYLYFPKPPGRAKDAAWELRYEPASGRTKLPLQK